MNVETVLGKYIKKIGERNSATVSGGLNTLQSSTTLMLSIIPVGCNVNFVLPALYAYQYVVSSSSL